MKSIYNDNVNDSLYKGDLFLLNQSFRIRILRIKKNLVKSINLKNK